MNFAELRSIQSNPGLLSSIEQLTSFLDPLYPGKIPLRQRLFHYTTGQYSPVVCQTCHTNIVGWSAKNKAYSSYCCIRCAQQSPDVRRKTEETCLLRYGETTNLKSAESRNKSRITCLEKYGVDNFAQTEQFRQQHDPPTDQLPVSWQCNRYHDRIQSVLKEICQMHTDHEQRL